MANYLYNGVELPDINEVWTDKETYPYAFVCRVETEDDEGKTEGVMILLSDTKGEFNDLNQAHMIPRPFNYCMYILVGSDYKYGEGGTMEVFFPLHSEGFITLLWASHDICRVVWNGNNYVDTDEVIFAASEPIPVVTAPTIEPLSMWMGWKAGNWVARQRGKKVEEEKTPVAYLYNGVRLPDINAVWTDKESHPYAYISHVTNEEFIIQTGNEYMLITASGEATLFNFGMFLAPAGNNYYCLTDAGWELGEANSPDLNVIDADVHGVKAIWASHDILNTDGSVYLAASEPVPVYE